jgi:ferric-dicitrate binding protein FerR (iron transport regulator)
MKHPDYNPKQLLALISEVLDGSVDDAGREALNEMLRTSPEALRFFREHMELHARLHLDYTAGEVTQFLPGLNQRQKSSRFPGLLVMGLVAAACIALAAVLLWPRPQMGPARQIADAFVTIEGSKSARWKSSDLPTKDGSRLGKGTLHLAEGLVTLRFDSGARVSLEAPVEMTLVDKMNCTLGSGVAVADVPNSAIGFRITTPEAKVVDYGTRFSVKVDHVYGTTHTQVHEGFVEVEHSTSGAVVALRAGQMATADKDRVEQAREWSEESFGRNTIGPAMRGPEWKFIEAAKDAYIGDATDKGVRVPRSNTLLLVKRSRNPHVERKAYLGFDLAGMEPDSIEDAELTLHFEPTGLGLASDVPDATFIVYGLLTEEPWEESSIKVGNAPAVRRFTTLEKNMVRELGRFVVEQGVQNGEFGIQGESLATFLRERAGSKVTLIVARDTLETRMTGLVHGFASRRHPTLPAPTLAIRLAKSEE